MSGKPFDREVVNQMERPVSSDMNQFASYNDLALREVLLNLFGGKATFPPSVSNDVRVVEPGANSAAFLGAAFKVRPVAGQLQVTLDPGLGFFNDTTPASSVGGVSGVDDLALIKPLTLTATETIVVPTADNNNPRIDIVEVQIDRRLMDPTSRDVFNVAAGQFQVGSVNKTLSYNQNGRSTVNGTGSINYKSGTAAPAPTAPAVDAGYVKIAEVFVSPAATALVVSNIKDLRALIFPGGMIPFAAEVLVQGGFQNAVMDRQMSVPGVQIGAISLDTLGTFQLVLVAGGLPNLVNPQGGTPVANYSAWPVSATGDQFVGGLPASGLWSFGATTAATGPLANATPGFTIAPGQPIWVGGGVHARSGSGTTPNGTVLFDVTGWMPTV